MLSYRLGSAKEDRWDLNDRHKYWGGTQFVLNDKPFR